MLSLHKCSVSRNAQSPEMQQSPESAVGKGARLCAPPLKRQIEFKIEWTCLLSGGAQSLAPFPTALSGDCTFLEPLIPAESRNLPLHLIRQRIAGERVAT